MTSKFKNQRQKKTGSVKVYDTPCTTVHNLRARKKRRKTYLLLKQTLRSSFALSQAYESRLTFQYFISN